jgi:hypothetical protein
MQITTIGFDLAKNVFQVHGTLHRLGIVLRHAPSFSVHVPEIELRVGVALVGSLAKPLHRLGIVLRHALTGLASFWQRYMAGSTRVSTRAI